MSVWGGLAVEVNGENVRNVTMADRVGILCFPAMAANASPARRVTVTLPAELVAGIDRYEPNRSRFIAEAVRHELKRRRHQDLECSLEHPHPDSLAAASLGLQSWAESLPIGDADLLDPAAGVPVRWSPGQGWDESQASDWPRLISKA